MMYKLFLIITATVAIHLKINASDLVKVSPVTDKILVIYFDDGHIDYGSASEGWKGNVVYNNPLNVFSAVQVNSYTIASTDDSNYSEPQKPLYVGRKSKGTDFNVPWAGANQWVQEHWIYIELPKPLSRGKTYSINLGNDLQASVQNKKSISFLYNEFSTWSPLIHVNQIGYKTTAPAKYAYLSQWMGDFNSGIHQSGGLDLSELNGTPFHLVNQDEGRIVYSGKIELRRTKTNQDSKPGNNASFDEFAPERNYTHADVWQCDFSEVKTPGNYRIVVERAGCSYPFKISEDPYFEPFYTCMKGLFVQRQGIHKYIEPGVEIPRDHHPDDVDVRYNPDFKFWINPNHGPKNWVDGTGSKINLWGGYHDAGDWDTYPHHIKVSLALLMLYDMAPEKFSDGDIGNRYKLNPADEKWIDEGSNGIPDVLDEARWLMDFYRRGRDELLAKKLGTGGVPGEYFGRDAGAGSGPWQDKREWAVTAESPAATYYLAATAAWYSECLKKLNTGKNEEINNLLQEALAAYQWATNYCSNNPNEINSSVKDARYVAAACLYRATREAVYQSDLKTFIASDNSYKNASSDWSNPNYWFFATINYVFLPPEFPGLDRTFQYEMKNKYLNMAETNLVNPAQDRAFRLGFSWNRNFALGTFSTPRMLGAALAYEITNDEKYLETVYFANDYFLGGNELNMVQVTGIGENPNKYVFHPTSWEINNYSSKVYSDETLAGMVTYFGDDDTWVSGPGDETWMRTSAFPPVAGWPESESRFDSRQSINGSEFTIHQSNVQAAVSYGYLTEGNKEQFKPNERPVIQMIYPEDNQKIAPGSDIQMQVNASGDVARVEYYFDEHFIGETSTAPFSMVWLNAPNGTFTITAKAFDTEGLIVRPVNPENKIDVRILVGSGTDVNATSVKIENCPSSALTIGNSYQLTATVYPLNATNRKLNWKSSNPEILTVNQSGELFVKGKGTANITVSSQNGNFWAECAVVTGNQTVGMSEFKKMEMPYKIYPNPAGNKLFIDGISQPVNISLRDSLGKVVLEKSSAKSSSCELDLSKIPAGFLVLQLTTDSARIFTSKIVRL